MGCFKIHSGGLKAQECTRWNLLLVRYEFHLTPITLNNVVHQLNWITPNKSSKHWFWAINTVFPGGIQKLPGAGSQGEPSRLPRVHLPPSSRNLPLRLQQCSSVQMCHEGWDDRDAREAGREGRVLQPSWFTGIMCGRQVHKQLYSFFFWICVSAWKWLCYINRYTGNWAINTNKIQSPKVYPYTFMSHLNICLPKRAFT